MNDSIRLKIILTKFNISLKRVISFLKSKKIRIENNPNIKINNSIYQLLVKEFYSDKKIRDASDKITLQKKKDKEIITQYSNKRYHNENIILAKAKKLQHIKTFGKIDLENLNITPKKHNKTFNYKYIKNNFNTQKPRAINQNSQKPRAINQNSQKPRAINQNSQKPRAINQNSQKPRAINQNSQKSINLDIKPKKYTVGKKKIDHISTEYTKLSGLKFTGTKIDLNQFNKTIPTPKNKKFIKKNQIYTKKIKQNNITNIEIDKQIKKTLEKIKQKKIKSKSSKYKKEKRDIKQEKLQNEVNKNIKTIKITEYATVHELAAIMKIHENKVILTCISLGIMATMNQRLDSETISLIADEFGYKADFVKLDTEDIYDKSLDNINNLKVRPPVVIVMGHVNHGKTSLLDYIRKQNTVSKEIGKITQHIGAYNVTLDDKKKITFLDTPGHEAFSAMRSRGSQITDIVLIVIDASSKIMPQTKEAINHAQIAGIPIIFAINKIDRQNAKPEKIREELANMNILVEEWGGKYQSQNISTITGEGIQELLKKIILESDMLDLKANATRLAQGVVIEATLDKGRGYITTILIQNGSLKQGDYIVAGSNYGKIKAILDEHGNYIKKTYPSQIVIILGLNGAPNAGDKFKIYQDEKEGKKIALNRHQIKREQAIRTQKHLTLEEIGRRISVGNFQEIKIIIKGDVDGSIEAIADSLHQLSNDNITINIIHKSVGQIIESDILLATASNSIIIGFNVKPSINAKKLAEKEKVKIYTYNIIYDAIDKIKKIILDSSKKTEEKIMGIAEIREVFNLNKMNSIYGCIITYGKVIKNMKIKIKRNKNYIYEGYIKSLKRFKEDVKEINKGYECGIVIKNFNNAVIGDVIESYY